MEIIFQGVSRKRAISGGDPSVGFLNWTDDLTQYLYGSSHILPLYLRLQFDERKEEIYTDRIMPIFFFFFFLAIILLISIRQINQYQKSVKFAFGKYYKTLEPGWRLIIPIIQSQQRVDMRVKAVDVPDQNAITKDNVSVNVNAVIYYKVISAEKAILEIENYQYAILQFAQTTMRNVVGETTLDDLLSGRENTAERIKTIVETTSTSWGLDVLNVELKDIKLPAEMERTIAKQAEAEREKRAVIITSEGEVAASKNMAEAARTLTSVQGALHLRTLQSINDVSSDASNTIIFTLPLETLQALTGYMANNGSSTPATGASKKTVVTVPQDA